MWRVSFALAYLSSAILPSPCLGASPVASKPKNKSGETTVVQFVDKLKRDGQSTEFPMVFIKLMSFPPDSTTRNFYSPPEDTSDGIDRAAMLVSYNAESGDGPVPSALFWTARIEVGRRSISYDYRTTLDGALEKAFRVDGETDETGSDIRGKGKLTKLDVGDAAVRERFQRDVLDFWLKGKGRKKAGAKAKSVKRSATPR